MTNVVNLFTGARGGICDICTRETGNLAAHRPACARRHGRYPSPVPIERAEEELIYRSGTHAVHEHLLEPQARLQGRVQDLDVARLVFQIERGTMVTPSPTGRTWRAHGLEGRIWSQNISLTRVVQEATRLGITRVVVERTGPNVYRTRLVAAPTHARSIKDRNRPACGLQDPHVLRWRLLDRDHLAYVDCQGCMDVALSCIAPAS